MQSARERRQESEKEKESWETLQRCLGDFVNGKEKRKPNKKK